MYETQGRFFLCCWQTNTHIHTNNQTHTRTHTHKHMHTNKHIHTHRLKHTQNLLTLHIPLCPFSALFSHLTPQTTTCHHPLKKVKLFCSSFTKDDFFSIFLDLCLSKTHIGQGFSILKIRRLTKN